MDTTKITAVHLDDLTDFHGEKLAIAIFEAFKENHVPDIQITPDFAIQVVRELPEGFAKVDPTKTEWRLYNPDSDSYLEWAECHRLVLPNGCHANIEVLDYTYYVDVEDSQGTVWECENCDHWEELSHVIIDFYENIQARIL